jgi:hypothetical protein
MPSGTLYVPLAGDGFAPQAYTVPGTVELDLTAVRADFDGSGASGDFFPVVEILDSSGNIMAQAVGSTVAAGGSASVTFAPFLRSAAAAAGGGIQFDTQPQAGQFLYAEADGPGTTADGYAIQLSDPNGNGIGLTSPIFAGFGQPGAPTWAMDGSGFHAILNSNGQTFSVWASTGDIMNARVTSGVPQLGFFTATPVPQQATPVTLGDVIALLQAYGLSA